MGWHDMAASVGWWARKVPRQHAVRQGDLARVGDGRLKGQLHRLAGRQRRQRQARPAAPDVLPCRLRRHSCCCWIAVAALERCAPATSCRTAISYSRWRSHPGGHAQHLCGIGQQLSASQFHTNRCGRCHGVAQQQRQRHHTQWRGGRKIVAQATRATELGQDRGAGMYPAGRGAAAGLSHELTSS